MSGGKPESARQRGLRRGMIAALTLAILLALGLGIQAWLRPGSDASFVGAQIGGPFTLVDQDGRTVSDADFRGKILLIYFGYTWCPDVCPTELQAMGLALDELGDRADQVLPVFITVDPERDTPEALKNYVVNFHERLIGLTGSNEQVAAAARAYRVYFQKAKDSAGTSDYLMDHSAYVYVMGRDGTYRTHFRPNTAPEEMAQKIRALL